jgi:protein-L-isoaspartate(D-aspartate) O-methyltransferase
MTRLPFNAFTAAAQSTQATACACEFSQPPTPAGLLETMLSALELTGGERVLEIGSSSGYETALLSQLSSEVVSLASDPEKAKARVLLFASLGCRNVRLFVGSGSAGWPDCAPYQAILVANGAPRLPQRLLDQLENDGRMVIPLGDQTGQLVELVRKHVDGVVSSALGPSHLPMLPWRRDSVFPWAGTGTAKL